MKKVLFALILLFSSLEAGWGAKESTHIFAETEWRDVYYYGSKVSIEGVLPNYDAVTRANDFETYLAGFKVNNRVGFIGDRAYVIQIAPSSVSMKSGKDFKQGVIDSYNGVNPAWLDAKKMGVKYAVEFTFSLNGSHAYCRVIYKNNRLFALLTTDENESRRIHFFESVSVK